MDLSELPYQRGYTGKRGRPTNSGLRDFENLYEVCTKLAANPKLTRADAIRQVIDTEKDYNGVDRLTRKLRRFPKMLENAKAYRQKAIEHFFAANAGTDFELKIIGFRSRHALAGYMLAKAGSPPEILDAPEVVEAIRKAWLASRPDPAMEAALRAHEMMERVYPYLEAERRWEEHAQQYRLMRSYGL